MEKLYRLILSPTLCRLNLDTAGASEVNGSECNEILCAGLVVDRARNGVSGGKGLSGETIDLYACATGQEDGHLFIVRGVEARGSSARADNSWKAKSEMGLKGCYEARKRHRRTWCLICRWVGKWRYSCRRAGNRDSRSPKLEWKLQ